MALKYRGNNVSHVSSQKYRAFTLFEGEKHQSMRMVKTVNTKRAFFLALRY